MPRRRPSPLDRPLRLGWSLAVALGAAVSVGRRPSAAPPAPPACPASTVSTVARRACTARGTSPSRPAAGCSSPSVRARSGSGSPSSGRGPHRWPCPPTSWPRARAGCWAWPSTRRSRPNRRVYTCFMSNRSGALDVRLVRWRMNAAVTALTDRADIVTGIPVSTGRHSGCRPAVRARRPDLDGHRRRRHARPCRRARRRSAARCSASTRTAAACRATRPRRSIRASTPTATATCRASRSAPAARRTRSSTAPAGTTR